MGPDLRYHLATLITVLCAVIVGVMIGAHLTDPKALERREKRLNDKVDNAMRESRKVQQEADHAKERAKDAQEELTMATKTLLPAVLNGKLAGKSVALIHCGGVNDVTAIKDTLSSVLQMAGAKLASVTEVDPKIIEDASRLAPVAEQLKWPQEDSANLDHFAKLLANALAYGDSTNSIRLLAKAKVVRMASDYTQPVNAVVLLGGADDVESKLAEALDRPLIKAMLALKLNVVGCETEQIPLSFMGEYARLHIPTVDNVDSWTGQVALVCALAGQRGHFGVKSGAGNKLPPLLP